MKFFVFIKKLVSDAVQKYYITSFFVFWFFVFAMILTRLSFSFIFGVANDGFIFGVNYELGLRLAWTFLFSAISSLVVYRIDSMMNGRLAKRGIIAISALILLLWAVYCFNININEVGIATMSRLGVICFVQFVMFFSAPYYKREGLGGHLWNVVGIIAQAFIFSLALMLGLFFIAFTLNSLFELSRYELIINEYGMIVTFCFTLVFPHFCLALYAREDAAVFAEAGERLANREDLDFISRVLLYYILMPLLIVYTLVLYVYFGKLALGGVFPNNLMANLVVWYLFASHIAMYFISGISSYKNEFERWLVTNSRKYIPALAIPATMMFISIFIRISTYGFTESRYLLLAFAVFNTLGLIMLFVYRHRAQFAIVLCAVCILVISFFGELSLYSVSYRSQMSKLQEKLALSGYSYDKIANGEVDLSDISVKAEEADAISSSLDVIRRNMPESADEELIDRLNQAFSSDYYDVRNKQYNEILFDYFYNEVYKISDDELFFELAAGNSRELGDGRYISAGIRGIHIFDKSPEDGGVEIYSNLFIDDIIENKTKKPTYTDTFEHDGKRYSVVILMREYSIRLDDEGDLLQDEYFDNYSVFVLIRRLP